MTLKINRVGLALILSLTTAFSSNLEPVQTQNEPNVQDGYYYIPPHQFKNWDSLTPKQQLKAKELGYNREAFTKYVLQSNPNTPKWSDFEANSTNHQ